MFKKGMSLLLAAALCFGMLPGQAFAAETEETEIAVTEETAVTEAVPAETEAEIPETEEAVPETAEETSLNAVEETFPAVTEEAIVEETQAAPLSASVIISGTCGVDLNWVLYDSGLLEISGSGAMDDYSDYSKVPWYGYTNGITHVRLPEGLTRIGDYAFYGCVVLAEVEIPDGVTGIGKYAFYNCKKLTTLAIPGSVTVIGYYAFGSCHGLLEMTLPDSITYLGENVFDNCSKLEKVTLPKGLKAIPNSLLESCSKLKEVEIPSGVTEIGRYAFRYCYALESLTIPASVATIKMYAFAWCNSLQELVFLGDAPAVEDEVFSGTYPRAYFPKGNTTWNNTPIRNMNTHMAWLRSDGTMEGTAGEGVTWSIEDSTILTVSGQGAVREGDISPWEGYNRHITRATVEAGVTALCQNAFYNCKKLEKVTFLGNAPAGTEIFGRDSYGNSWSTLAYYPLGNPTWTKEVREAYGDEAVWVRSDGLMDEGTFGENVTWKLTVDGILRFSGTGDMTTVTDSSLIPWRPYRDWVRHIIVEDGITSVGSYVLHYCNNLEEITLGRSVRKIGFTYTESLKKVNISDLAAWCGISGDFRQNFFKNGAGLYLNGKLVTDAVIPGSVNAITNYAFRDYQHLSSVTIERGVETIGQYAFAGCTGLTSVKIAGSVKEVGYNAFYGCTALAEVSLGEGLETIGNHAFSGCTALSSLTVPESVNHIYYDAFENCTALQSVSLPEQCTLGEGVFEGCTALISVKVPVGNHGENVFKGCTGLKEAVLTEGLTVILKEMFTGCTALEQVEIPGTVTEIRAAAFQGCSKLKSVSLPEVLSTIRENAFDGCSGLTEIVIPGGVYSMGSLAFNGCTGLKRVEFIGNGPETLAENAFTGVTATVVYPANNATWEGIAGKNYGGSLTWVEKEGPAVVASGDCGKTMTWVLDENGVLTITGRGEMTNYNNNAPWRSHNSKIKELRFQGDIRSIGDYAFRSCRNLTSLTVPKSLEWIGSYAFQGCTGLTELKLTDKVQLNERAFSGCTGLKEVEIPGGKNQYDGIGYYAFENCAGLTRVTVMEGVVSIGGGSFLGCTNLESVKLPDSLRYINGEAFRDCKKLKSIAIPEGVVSINHNAFSGCTGLTEIVIPDGVTELQNVFEGCTGLKSVTLPDSLITVDDFSGCSSLTELVLPEGISEVSIHAPGLKALEIPEGVQKLCLNGCSSLISVAVPDSVTTLGFENGYNAFEGCFSLTSVTLGSGITWLGNGTFGNCESLMQLTIPASVEALDDNVFWGCRNLKTLTFKGSAPEFAEWALSDLVLTVRYPGSNDTWTREVMQNYGGEIIWEAYDVVAGGRTEDGMTWEVDGDYTLTVYGSGEMQDYPANARTVTNPWSAYAGKVRKVVLMGNITRIGAYAFDGFRNVTEVMLPASLREIGDYAFRGCEALKTVYYGGETENWEHVAVGQGNGALEEAKLLSTSHIHQPEVQSIAGMAPTETTPGSKPFRVTVCRTCGEWLNDNGEAMTQAEKDEILRQNTLYISAADVSVYWENMNVSGRKLLVDLAKEIMTLKLDAEISPSGARQEIQWSSSDKTVAAVDEAGCVTFGKPGTAKITAATVDGSKKSASVTIEVFYRDSAKKLTVKLAEVTDIYGVSSKSGLQVGDSVGLEVYGSDPDIALDGLEFKVVSGDAYVSVDHYGTVTAIKGGGTAKVEASLTGDPLKRKATISIKTIAVAPKVLEIATAEAEASVLDDGYLLADGFLQKEAGLTLLAKKGDSRSFTVYAQGFDGAGNAMSDPGGLTWSSSNSRLVTVKAGKDNSAVVTVKAKTSGECLITAVSKMDKNVKAVLRVEVKDFAPVLSGSKVAMNTYLADPAEDMALTEKAGNEILSVELWEYDSGSRDYILGDDPELWADYSAGTVTIDTMQDQWLKNGTRKVQLHVQTRHEGAYVFPVSVTVKNSLPAVTVKQTKKLNWLSLEQCGLLTVTAKNAEVKDVYLSDEMGFAVDEEQDGAYRLVYKDGADEKALKGTVTVELKGYRYAVVKSFAVGTERKAVALTMNSYLTDAGVTLALPRSVGDSADHAVVYEYNKVSKDYDLVSEEFAAQVLNGQVEIRPASDWEVLKNGARKLRVEAACDSGTLRADVSLTVKNAAPSVTVKQTRKLNLLDENSYAQILVTAKNTAVADVTLEGMNCYTEEAEAPGSYRVICMDTEELTKGKVLVELEGYRYITEKAFKLATEKAAMKPVLGSTVLTLYRDLPELAAETTLTTSYAGIGVEDMEFECTNAQGQKLLVYCAGGQILAYAEDPEDMPKTGSYRFSGTPVAEDGMVLSKINLTVKVAASPKITFSPSTVKLKDGGEETVVKVTAPQFQGAPLKLLVEEAFADVLSLEYEDGMAVAALREGHGLALGKTCSVRVTPEYGGCALKPITLKIRVVE